MAESSPNSAKTTSLTRSSIPQHKISGKAAAVRIFQRDWMEAFTFISFRTFLIFCFIFESIVLCVTVLYSMSPWRTVSCVLLGIPFWILIEYILHRFIFHFSSNYKAVQRIIYIFHGNHHVQPNHPCRTLMPIIVTLPVGLLVWLSFSFVLGAGLGSALFLGFYTGYVFYDCIHFATHNFHMKHFPFSLWKRHHLLHHYRTEKHNYSITLPWLDVLFRTNFKP